MAALNQLRRAVPLSVLWFAVVAAGAPLGGEPCEVQLLIGSRPQDTSGFGSSFDIQGDLAVVGDPRALDEEGEAHIFRRINGEWTLETVLTSGIVQIENSFGHDVSLSGDVLAVCDPSFDDVWGAVYIYRHNGAAWILEDVLHAPPNAARFGRSVSVDGDVLVVGAPFYFEDSMSEIGAAYIYRFDGIEWQLEDELVNPTPEAFDIFGWAVVVEDGIALIGAHGANHGANNSGEVNVYILQDNDWILTQTLLPAPPDEQCWFGRSVALANGKAIVGAPEQGLNENEGRAYIFDRAKNTWTFETILQASNPGGNSAYFGQSVALSPNGQVALVGAPVDSGAAFRAGAAYRFEHTSEGWVQTAKIYASDAQGGDSFGEAVALDHDIAMIGTADSEPMQAYVFEGFSGIDCNGNEQPDACDIFLGLSLDLNADEIPDECQQPCPADINSSGGVEVGDLLAVINAWGPCPLPCPSDVVLNGQVDVSDLLAVINAWGACP